MILFVHEGRRVNSMSNKSVISISEDVIEECLADSIEKVSK